MSQQNNCTMLAIASVPMQEWRQTYRPEDAWRNGTIFPELNLPLAYARGNQQTNRKEDCSR